MALDSKTSPLVILGFDAGDPRFMLRWAQEGCLPTVASILERGCWGKTAGPELISEHGVWLTLFSGLSRGESGHYYFRQLKPGTYDLQEVTGLDVDAPPFWSCLQGTEKKVATIDVPDVYPVRGLPGMQLANWAVHLGWISRNPAHAPCAEPRGILQEAHRIFGPPMNIIEKSDSSYEEDRRIYRRLREQVEKKGALCRHLLAQDQFDLVVIIFSESHAAGHQFWKYRPEAQGGSSGSSNNGLTHAIRDVYQAIDRQMGLLLDQLPKQANVFVVSTVGFDNYYPTHTLMEAFCRQLGYQAPAEPAPFSLKPMAVIRRMAPEAWRIALSRHFPRDTRERLLAGQFRTGTNWRKTTAFAIPSFYTSFLRVNLRGREPEGIVEPGAEYDVLLGRLDADLRQLVDPETGKPVVKQVWRTRDLFGGALPHALPDIFVEWQPVSHFLGRVVHPKAELMPRKPEFLRNSDHAKNGFVAAAGPGIRGRGERGDLSPLDLAPTFLTLLGVSVPRGLTGKTAEAIIAGDAARP